MTELIEDSILKRIIGNDDGMGTTYKDFIVLPGRTKKKHVPESIDISTNLAGVNLYIPFIAAAMRSVVNKEFALEASKKMMAVAPRSLPIDEQVDIVGHVKRNEVQPGEIEYQENPVRVGDKETLGDATTKVMEYGHSHIPVVDKFQHYKGMFIYKPIEHDRADQNIPITMMMKRFTTKKAPFCRTTTGEEKIKGYMRDKKLRMVPVLDSENRLRRLVFLQERKAYRVGAAIDTHKGWMTRARELVKAGADMIFTDTSDGHSEFEIDVVREYKSRFPDGPPICAGNIVTPEGFRDLAEAGADAVKLNMGPGSICSTNKVLGVGAPPMWALINVAVERLKYFKKTERYIPIIPDGGMEDTYDINVALVLGDAVMSGLLFAGFEESAGEVNIGKDGTKYKVYYGEASEEAVMRSGHTGRYFGTARSFVIQGVKSNVPLIGRFKPGVEGYANTLKQAHCHVGCSDLKEYRASARLLRLTEASKYIAMPHGVNVVD